MDVAEQILIFSRGAEDPISIFVSIKILNRYRIFLLNIGWNPPDIDHFPNKYRLKVSRYRFLLRT